ncbi:NYN domain-containing protein [Roseovarius phycicola]|uniref:NYN domain-containing protein n=1 Tax=Roseovarius phycicola TaxID=3080976 RepID=A0ABZ2HMF1_9RHOB
MPDDPKLLAVLIDADNVPAKHADAILREVTKYGEPGLRRVYGDWSDARLSGWSKAAQELGLVQHQQSANTKGKNASDIGLVIDAMDILHTGHFDEFVLVSSDSDFTRLASRIRESGLTVNVIGERKTPSALKNACNRFVAIETISQKPVDKNTDALKKEAKILILRAIEKIDLDVEWYPLNRIGQLIRADKPDFDPRNYGHTKLIDMVKTIKGFATKTEGETNVYIQCEK